MFEKNKIKKIISLMNSLSDEELEEVFAELGVEEIDEGEDLSQENTTPENEQFEAETNLKTSVKDEADAPASDEISEEGEFKDTEEPCEESSKETPDKVAELESMLNSLRETVEALVARLDAAEENKDEKEPFGLEDGGDGTQTNDGKSDVQKAIQKHWNF